MRNRNALLILTLSLLAACAPQTNYHGRLGLSDDRRVVIVGENIDPAIALYYQRKYDCLVWFTPYEGKVANTANNFLKTGWGPSLAMRGLIEELKSINMTFGRWEILVPKVGEKYFLTALKHLPRSAISKARGTIVLIDSAGSTAMEQEVRRVSDGNFFVTYEFQKELTE